MISAPLPAGLLFNTSTGRISGTPTAVQVMTPFQITATNSSGSTSLTLSITVKDVAPTTLTYSSNPAIYPAGTAITNNTPSASGGAILSFSVNPALPAGLSISSATGTISGTPSTAAAAANFAVTASNSGGSTSATLSIMIAPMPGPSPSPSVTPTGRTFYFSTASGDDLRTSAQAQNSATPWKTLSKLNSFFSSFVAGDTILFKRGEVFSGEIIVNKSGTASAPITLGAYGTGDRPIISGLITLTTWTDLGGGIYQSDCASCQSTLNQVTVNGVSKAMGRWPNITDAGKGYRTITSHTNNTSITDTGLSSASSTNWSGAEVVIRKNHYVLDRSIVTSQAGNTLNYTASVSDIPIDGFGYFIQNDPRTLDQFGEWYFNPTTKTVQMYFGSNSPSSYTVQVSNVNTLVTVLNKSYITFDNLFFSGSNLKTINVGGATNVTIQNSDITFSGRDAIVGANMGSSSPGFKIVNSTIDHTHNNAISLPNEFVSPSIIGNTIQNSGMIEGMGDPGTGHFQAYRAITTYLVNGALIKSNKIINSGYTGVHFLGNNTVIQNNFISSFCNTIDDGGGIYTWNGPGSQFTLTNNKILSNIVMNGVGAPFGTDDNYAAAQGIYMDDNSMGVEIAGNTSAFNTYSGLFVHNSHDINVHDNTLFGNGVMQLLVSGESTQFLIRNLTLKNNIFFSKEADQKAASFDSFATEIPLFGTFDYNYYARPIDDNQTIDSITNGYTGFAHQTLANWKAYVSQDTNSKKSPKAVTTVNDIRFEYNATDTAVTIALGATYIDLGGEVHSGSIQLAPYSSIILIKN